MRHALALCLLTPAFLPAADPAVKLPAEVKALPGRVATLKAELTDGKQVRWAVTSEAADLIPFPGTTQAIFVSPTAGRYLVLCWTAAGDVPSEAARCWVVVGDVPPGPTPPGPTPPNPPPAPPVPNPLAERLKAAYAADPGEAAAKGANKSLLAEVYRQAPALLADARYTTAGEVLDKLREASASLTGGSLVGLRTAVGKEIAAAFPGGRAEPLTDANRKAAGELFAKLAAALDSF